MAWWNLLAHDQPAEDVAEYVEDAVPPVPHHYLYGLSQGSVQPVHASEGVSSTQMSPADPTLATIRERRPWWAPVARKYVVLCWLCGGLAVLLGLMYVLVHFLLRAHTSSLHYFETVPTYVPACVMMVTGLLILCFVKRRNRFSYLIKLAGVCCVLSATLCVVITVTTTVVHMSRLQTLTECVFAKSLGSCTCFAGRVPPLPDGKEVSYVFSSVPDCEVIHGTLYSCLRALFGISVVGILLCIFSAMLIYQLISHERKKMYWEQLEMRRRRFFDDHPPFPPSFCQSEPWNRCSLIDNSACWSQPVSALPTPIPEDAVNSRSLLIDGSTAPARHSSATWSRRLSFLRYGRSGRGRERRAAGRRPAPAYQQQTVTMRRAGRSNDGVFLHLASQQRYSCPPVIAAAWGQWGPPPPYSHPSSLENIIQQATSSPTRRLQDVTEHQSNSPEPPLQHQLRQHSAALSSSQKQDCHSGGRLKPVGLPVFLPMLPQISGSLPLRASHRTASRPMFRRSSMEEISSASVTSSSSPDTAGSASAEQNSLSISDAYDLVGESDCFSPISEHSGRTAPTLEQTTSTHNTIESMQAASRRYVIGRAESARGFASETIAEKRGLRRKKSRLLSGLRENDYTTNHLLPRGVATSAPSAVTSLSLLPGKQRKRRRARKRGRRADPTESRHRASGARTSAAVSSESDSLGVRIRAVAANSLSKSAPMATPDVYEARIESEVSSSACNVATTPASRFLSDDHCVVAGGTPRGHTIPFTTSSVCRSFPNTPQRKHYSLEDSITPVRLASSTERLSYRVQDRSPLHFRPASKTAFAAASSFSVTSALAINTVTRLHQPLIPQTLQNETHWSTRSHPSSPAQSRRMAGNHGSVYVFNSFPSSPCSKNDGCGKNGSVYTNDNTRCVFLGSAESQSISGHEFSLFETTAAHDSAEPKALQSTGNLRESLGKRSYLGQKRCISLSMSSDNKSGNSHDKRKKKLKSERRRYSSRKSTVFHENEMRGRRAF